MPRVRVRAQLKALAAAKARGAQVVFGIIAGELQGRLNRIYVTGTPTIISQSQRVG